MTCKSCKSATCNGACKSITLPATLNKGATGANGADGASAFMYIGYATSNTGADFATAPFASANWVSFKNTTEASTNDVNLHAGNWIELECPCTSSNGEDGTNGVGISQIELTDGDGSPGTTDTYTITYSDATTSTFTVTNGANGESGAAGTSQQILYGTIAPGDILGEDGDSYIDTITGNLYSKAAGAWTLETNLKGPTGATGATGPAGPAGTAANNKYAAIMISSDKTINTTTVATPIEEWETSEASGYSVSLNDGTLTVNENVTTIVEFNIAFTSGSSEEFTFTIYKNGTTITNLLVFASTGSSSAKSGKASLRFPITLINGDSLVIKVASNSTATLVIKNATFIIEGK